MFLAVNWSNGAYVFFAIIAIIVVIGLTILLFYRFRRDYRNYRDEMTSLIDGALSKNEITFSINSYINKIPKDRSFALMLLNFDKFTEIINAFGEKETQKILERCIANIDKALPQKVQIGRYGKDEFLILVRGDFDRNDTMRLADRIKEAASLPIKVMANTEANQHVSIGVAYYPYHGRNLKQLLTSLNLAVYIAKRDGGDAVVLYSDEMNEKESENIQYYSEIKSAIENKQFMLYYQPIINVNTKEVYGCEALLRWQHPEHGVLTPAKFIHIIEQSGDINWVGNWGIECLIKEYLTLKKMFPDRIFQLSMNLSPKQLTNENLIMNFQNLIKKYRMLARNLTLEIIEFAIFEKHDVVKNNLMKLKELGFQIAVDGFAMDRVILEKVETLPIDIIKLDKDFLEEDESSFLKARYAEMLIEFAEKNNKKIICEGIENIEMLERAKNYNIDLVQGYYLSKPISEEDLLIYLKDKNNVLNKLDPELAKQEIVEEEEPFNASVMEDEEVVSSEKSEEDALKEEEISKIAPSNPKKTAKNGPKNESKSSSESDKDN